MLVSLSMGQAVAKEASVVIRFGSGNAYLDSEDKAKLRQFFQKYDIGAHSRVFVVGYTDAIGNKDHNYKLSRNRAKAIRREIISSFGLDATVVMAMGKGEESPVGDNRSASGRASNRRAEIYLVNTDMRKPDRVFGPKDPYFKDINALVEQAKDLIKKRQLAEAVKVLKKARGMGGDHYSDWHATYGIAGFYAHAPQQEVNAHLAAALRIDPYNYDARDYLSRLTARQSVAKGVVTRHMGDSVENAIAVTAIVQQHEYLRLFKVVPLSHRQLEGYPVDVWDCVDSQGVAISYYFDHSRVYGWAFAKGQTNTTLQELPVTAQLPPTKASAPSSKGAQGQQPAGPDDPKRIWESKIFK